MIFIETTIFSKYLYTYLSDEQYMELQSFLMENPDAGDLIQDTGGLRKLRWSARQRGKRGGIRVIYYSYVTKDQIYLMTLYAKNEVSDLSTAEKKVLKQLLEATIKGH